MPLILTDLFSNVEFLVSGRVYPGILPEGPTYPAIIYNVISGRRMRNISGLSDNENMIVQIDLFSEDYSEGDVIIKDLIAMLAEGPFVIGNQNDMRVSFEPDQNVNRFSLDVSVWNR